MDSVEEKLAEMEWPFVDSDPAALEELTRRVADAGRGRCLVTYSDLVRGVRFCLPNVRQGEPFEIDVEEWTGQDRQIVGDFLGAISAESYRRGRFFASALVVGKVQSQPSGHFFEWMEQLGVLPNLREDTVLAFWAEQVNKAHRWYQSH